MVRESVLVSPSVVLPFTCNAPPIVVRPVPVVKEVAPVWVKLPDKVVASTKEIKLLPESITILPVEAPPTNKVWALVVPRLPAAVKNVLLFEPAERLAVGTPEFTFKKANFALAVDCPPMRKSCVIFLS